MFPLERYMYENLKQELLSFRQMFVIAVIFGVQHVGLCYFSLIIQIIVVKRRVVITTWLYPENIH